MVGIGHRDIGRISSRAAAGACPRVGGSIRITQPWWAQPTPLLARASQMEFKLLKYQGKDQHGERNQKRSHICGANSHTRKLARDRTDVLTISTAKHPGAIRSRVGPLR